MIEVRYYVTEDGRSPYADWFSVLDSAARAKVATAIARIGEGNLSNVKSVGNGVFECRINFGPAYRVYLGRDGDKVVILLAGGTKKKQQRDIEVASNYWQAYKRGKQRR